MTCCLCKKDPLEYREINNILDENNEEVIICDECLQKFRNIKQTVK